MPKKAGGTAVKERPVEVLAEDPDPVAEQQTGPGNAKPLAQNRPLDEVAETLNVLYVGDGGTGKTSDIAAMAKLGKILIINAESGVKARALRQLAIPTENIMVRPDVQAGEQLSFKMLESLFWELKRDLEDDPNSWAGVGWDSVTEIHKVVLKAATAYRADKARRSGRGNDDADMTDIADYGIMSEQMRELIRRYRDLPCHFAASALTRRDKDDDGRVVYRPAVTPALQTDLFGYMDIVCVTTEEVVGGEVEYQGLFGASGKHRGKDRFHALPKRLVDPWFDRLVAYVNEDLTVESDPLMEEHFERKARQLELDAAAAEAAN